MTIDEVKRLRESEDKVEFKEAKKQYKYDKDRRSILGYVVALANECGGRLILGVKENNVPPHTIVGTQAWKGREGELEQKIYHDLHVRVETEVVYDDEKRVLIIHVPSRPIGKALKYQDVPLMRIGDSIVPMNDEYFFSILQEQEPDFSAQTCAGLNLDDLDENAINKMKLSYARKQNNEQFINLSTSQTLSDLNLIDSKGNLNYACLILLGKGTVIQSKLPQCKTIWEFRNQDDQIYYDTREEIQAPLFIAIDSIWKLINQPMLNRKHPIQSDAYIFDLYDFNEEVIREAILNAIVHRDYTISSEVVIKQYPNKITINNPGGFPKGVNIENILTVNSTPRCRLMAEVLEKTGLVERSGQGVDKIYSIMLSEGKSEPDYTDSNIFQVSLTLNTEIKDKAFHIYINQYKNNNKEPRLGVEQIITLYMIRNGMFQRLKSDIAEQLEKAGLIKRVSGHSLRFILDEDFYSLEEQSNRIGKRYIVSEIESILLKLQGNESKVGALEEQMKHELNRNQIKYLLMKLQEDNIIQTTGKGSGTKYIISKKYNHLRGDSLLNEVFNVLYAKYDN
ncbi:ATP-binding protein [Porphyromonadaceae bacterium W3.11]|nr:ATP-binding protein [Porphyromonadaceae bacterium W3.11]